jgi:sporulation protein YunB
MYFKSKKIFSITDLIILIIIIVLLNTYIFIRIFTIKSESFLNEFAKNKSTQLSTVIINNALFEIINNKDYSSFMETKTNNDDLVDIRLNNEKINRLLYSVNDSIINNIRKIESGNYNGINIDYLEKEDFIFNVPIGVIYDIPIFVGIGPKIPFKIDILGNADNSIYTKVREYGINNSIIEVVLNIKLNIEVILPFTSNVIQIDKEIPIDTKIIEGKVPTYYGSVQNKSN